MKFAPHKYNRLFAMTPDGRGLYVNLANIREICSFSKSFGLSIFPNFRGVNQSLF